MVVCIAVYVCVCVRPSVCPTNTAHSTGRPPPFSSSVVSGVRRAVARGRVQTTAQRHVRPSSSSSSSCGRRAVVDRVRHTSRLRLVPRLLMLLAYSIALTSFIARLVCICAYISISCVRNFAQLTRADSRLIRCLRACSANVPTRTS